MLIATGIWTAEPVTGDAGHRFTLSPIAYFADADCADDAGLPYDDDPAVDVTVYVDAAQYAASGLNVADMSCEAFDDATFPTIWTHEYIDYQLCLHHLPAATVAAIRGHLNISD